MRVGIDARNLSDPQPGGFKLYTTALIQGLSQLGVADEFVALLDRPTDAGHLGLAPNIILKPIPGYRRMWHEAWALGPAMRAEGVDVAHFTVNLAPFRAPSPMVMTIHDTFGVEPHRWRGMALELGGRYRSPKQRLADLWWGWMCHVGARQADVVICPSEATMRDVVRVLKVPKERIRVVLNGSADWFRQITPAEVTAVTGRFGLKPNYVLCFASRDPRKNIGRFVAAYAGLDPALRSAHPLTVIASGAQILPIFETLALRYGITADMQIVQRPTDEDVTALYNGAALLGFPSLGEGFGAPVIEAMACGCPVLASNVTSVPEVAGDAALLVDPMSTDAIRGGIERLLTDRSYADLLRERGLGRARLFPWRKTAEGTLAAYREAVKS